ncbi:hypothetical protein [Georgenia yuyongxinii]
MVTAPAPAPTPGGLPTGGLAGRRPVLGVADWVTGAATSARAAVRGPAGAGTRAAGTAGQHTAVGAGRSPADRPAGLVGGPVAGPAAAAVRGLTGAAETRSRGTASPAPASVRMLTASRRTPNMLESPARSRGAGAGAAVVGKAVSARLAVRSSLGIAAPSRPAMAGALTVRSEGSGAQAWSAAGDSHAAQPSGATSRVALADAAQSPTPRPDGATTFAPSGRAPSDAARSAAARGSVVTGDGSGRLHRSMFAPPTDLFAGTTPAAQGWVRRAVAPGGRRGAAADGSVAGTPAPAGARDGARPRARAASGAHAAAGAGRGSGADTRSYRGGRTAGTDRPWYQGAAPVRPGTSAVAGRAVLPPATAAPRIIHRLVAGMSPAVAPAVAGPAPAPAAARPPGPGLPRTLAALQALGVPPATAEQPSAGELRQEGPTMSVRHPAVASAGPGAPPTALAFRRRDLDGAAGPLDLDELVDLVAERVEERVVAELERRGRRGGMGVF